MRTYWIAALCLAACASAGLAARGEAAAAASGSSARAHAAKATELSSQQRRRRTRIEVYPRYIYPRLIGPPGFGIDLYPRPYPYDWPGPGAQRDCVSWLAPEARPSGTVIVPQRRCRWVPG